MVFSLTEVRALVPSARIVKSCGHVAGYPAELTFVRALGGGALGLGLNFHVPRPSTKLAGQPTIAGVALKVDFALPAGATLFCSPFFTSKAVQLPDPFNKPWDEIVADDSPFFPGGTLEVTLTVKLAVQA